MSMIYFDKYSENVFNKNNLNAWITAGPIHIAKLPLMKRKKFHVCTMNNIVY